MNSRQERQRSEKLRRRIQQESQESIRQAANRLVNVPVSQAQVDVTPLAEKVKGENSGAVKRRFKVGWRILSLLTSGILTYILYVAWQFPEYKVSSVQVLGLQRITQEEALANINLTGMHIFAVIPQQITGILQEGFPEFRDIDVKVNLPARVEIDILERQPAIAWQTKESLIWIDNEGYLIPPRGTPGDLLTIQADSLPAYHLKSTSAVSGSGKMITDKASMKPNQSPLAFFAQPKQVDGALLTAILQLNAWMPQEKTLLYQQQRGLGWADIRGWDVFIGQKLENINEKMVMYETIVRQLEEQGIGPSMVSVEFLHAPYYRTD